MFLIIIEILQKIILVSEYSTFLKPNNLLFEMSGHTGCISYNQSVGIDVLSKRLSNCHSSFHVKNLTIFYLKHLVTLVANILNEAVGTDVLIKRLTCSSFRFSTS